MTGSLKTRILFNMIYKNAFCQNPFTGMRSVLITDAVGMVHKCFSQQGRPSNPPNLFLSMATRHLLNWSG